MNVYDPAMASAYLRGRGLRAADLEAWTAAAGPYLRAPVLDLGAGTGRFTAALSRALGAHSPAAPAVSEPVPAGPAIPLRTGGVLACEPSAAMRAAFPRHGFPLVGGSGEALPFASGSFATVWASQILHHVRDLPAFAAELRRVLSAGGHLLIRGGFGEPGAVPLAAYFASAFPGHQALLAEVTRLLAATGLAFVTRIEVSQLYAADADEMIAKVATRSLSNLAALPSEAFDAGLRHLTADARSGRLRFPLHEHLDLVVFG